MPSLNDVKSQIAGVGKTKQITKAMGMVASASLRTMQGRYNRFKPYGQKFGEMLDTLSVSIKDINHPLLTRKQDPKTSLILLLTSDKGLCGAFNINSINKSLRLAKELESEGKTVSFVCMGAKGNDVIKKTSYPIHAKFIGLMNHFNFSLAVRLVNLVTQAFTSNEFDEIHMVYSEFQSISRQNPKSVLVLPIAKDSIIATEEPTDLSKPKIQSNYIFEPNAEVLLAEILPRFLNVLIYQALLEVNVGKSAARMVAMNNATTNCNDLIVSLTLLYNKARQASITNDLIDIVSGANALQSQ